MSRHFRARITPTGKRAFGRIVYGFEVVNTATGEVIARDNHCGMSKLHDEARALVRACELAWSYNIGRRDLRHR